MKKKLTIKEIAELSGVGKSTISRFFNDGYVSESVREKIEKVINENNYEPNVFARGIKAKNNRFIGVIVPCLDSTITSTILMNLDNRLRELGYIPLIINTNHNVSLEISNLENLSRLNVEGIILVATEVTKKHKDFVRKSKIPVLFIGQICEETYCIVNDEEKAGQVMGEYILNSNHKDILYVSVDENDTLVGIVRKKAVLDKILINNVKLDVEISDFSMDSTEKLVYNYMKKRKPTCIICATDNMAFGAIKALNSLEIKIPEEVSVVGFGGYKISDLICPSLTTIKFYNSLTGELAAESIVKLLNKENIPKIQKIEFEFLERKSVKKLNS